MSQSQPGEPTDDPFANVVDDTEARKQARDWAFDCLRQGQSPESVESQLIANGWSASDAAEMAEEARKKTRHMRGVVTRDDVAEASESAYRQSIRSAYRSGHVPAFNDGYIGQPEGFVDTAGTGKSDQGSVLSYPREDKAQTRRLRTARFHAIVQVCIGTGLLALGVLFGFVFARSEDEMGMRGWIIVILAVAGGLSTIVNAAFQLRSPTRLIAKIDRGALDRRNR